MERFNFKALNDVEGKEQFRVEVSNWFAALEDLGAEVEINSAWETIRDNIKISAKDSLGSTKDVQNYYNKGNEINCSGYRIQVKLMGIISTML
jgi:hypothetical protein